MEYTSRAVGEIKKLDLCALSPAFGQWGANLVLVV